MFSGMDVVIQSPLDLVDPALESTHTTHAYVVLNRGAILVHVIDSGVLAKLSLRLPGQKLDA